MYQGQRDPLAVHPSLNHIGFKERGKIYTEHNSVKNKPTKGAFGKRIKKSKTKLDK